MDALVFDKKSGQFGLKNVPKPTVVQPNDVVIEVKYSGVCGTDLHIIENAFPCNDKIPFTLGHEFCGVVVGAGPKAHFSVGQRVVVDPNSGCGVCNSCHNGRYHLCEEGGINSTLGIWKNGGWAKYCVAPDTQVFALPNDIDFDKGALCEPLSCLARGWDRAGQMPVGIDIVILGAGIIGNLWSVLLHLQGHRKVTVSEPNPARLAIAKKMDLGFTYIQPKDLNSNASFDVIIDCTGAAKVMEVSMQFLKKSGRYVLFGCANPNDYAKINPFEIYAKEATIIGVNINPFTFPKAIGLLQSLGDRYLNYEKLGIKVYDLKDYEAAVKDAKAGIVSKAIFKLK